MDELLYKLSELFLISWNCHLRTHGMHNIAEHETLNSLYNDLKEFVDELSETYVSLGNPISLPATLTVPNISNDKLVKELKTFRDYIINHTCEPELDDFKGRLVTKLSHYIFMLNTAAAGTKLFDSTSIDLIKEIKKRFKNQNDFVTAFDYYIKGSSRLPSRVSEFFRTNEAELTKLSDDILDKNMQLFSIRDFISTQSDEVIEDYNQLVKYCDIFK